MTYLYRCDEINGCGDTYPADMSACPHCGTPSIFGYPVPLNPRDYVYDIETYPNIFTFHSISMATGMKWGFEISDEVNQYDDFVNFLWQLKHSKSRMVGYNNEFFDYSVIHFMLNTPGVNHVDIYNKSMSIIHSSHEERFNHVIWDRDRFVEQLDLFKMNHFDNKAKSTSLKALEFSMRMDSVEDLPFDVGLRLDNAKKRVLHHYNDHDCEATGRFYVRCLPMITLREKLCEKFPNINFMNMNDVKMGAQLLIHELENHGIECYDRSSGRRRPRQTIRSQINLAEVIFPYVKFERPEFNAIKNYLASKIIRETKGVFTDIKPPAELLPFVNPNNVKVKSAGKWVKLNKSENPDMSTAISSNLHCMIDGYTYYFGTGGIHASVESCIIDSNDEYQIVDVDVTSFYPSLAIKNRLYPAHLGVEYCDAYNNVFITRQSYPKKTPENEAYKLALNGTYGGSNDPYSPFFDPFYTMSITINGQLLLCMLAEQLLKIPGLKMIQCNTDGVTFYCPRQYLDHQRSIQKWWESVTQLGLEEALYSRMAIRDVNNYIAITTGGYVKRIGAYAHVTPDIKPGTREVGWHKDPSMLIVPKAAEAALVNGTDISNFIRGHRDMFDFMKRAKIPRADSLVMRWPEFETEIKMPNITRYFVSNTGGYLFKQSASRGEPGTWKRKNGISDSFYRQVMLEISQKSDNDVTGEFDALGTPWDERIHTKSKSKWPDLIETSQCSGKTVTVCNHVNDFDWSLLDYDYYIDETKKLVDPLINGHFI